MTRFVATFLLALGLCFAQHRPRKLLVIDRSMRDGKPVRGHASIPAANAALAAMGRRTGAFEAVFDSDFERLRPSRIGEFDAICFNNAYGVLFEDAELRESLLRFVREGKGFVGFHAAAAAFTQWPRYDFFPEFGRMLGATENGGHPWTPEESFPIRIDEPEHPLNATFAGRGLTVSDEVFQFQEPDLRSRLRVLTSIDPEKADFDARRRILPQRMADKDFPMTWIKPYGKGRVFYSALGHNPAVFENAALLEHFLAGIRYALGDLRADDTPRAKVAQ